MIKSYTFFGPHSMSFGPGNNSFGHACFVSGPAHPPVGPSRAQGSAAPLSLCHIGFPASFRFSTLLKVYFSHLFRPFQFAGLNLVSPCALGGVHLVSISELPSNRVHLIQNNKLPELTGFQYLHFPHSISATSCFHLVSVFSDLAPGAPQQLPAFI